MERAPVPRISDSRSRFDARRVAHAFLWPGEVFRVTGPETAEWTDEYLAVDATLSDREAEALNVLLRVRIRRAIRQRYAEKLELLRRDCEKVRLTRYLASQGARDLAGKLYARLGAVLGPTRPVDPKSELCAALAADGFKVREIVDVMAALLDGRCPCTRPRCGGCEVSYRPGGKRRKLRPRGMKEKDAVNANAVRRRIELARGRGARPDLPAWSPEERQTVRAAVSIALADVELSPLETGRLLGLLGLLDPTNAADAALLALPAVEPRAELETKPGAVVAA